MKRIVVLFLIMAFGLSGCGFFMTTPALKSNTFFAMDTVMEIKHYGIDELVSESEELVKDLEKKFSVTDKNSEIYALNSEKTCVVSADTSEIISRALELCRLTDGTLDISIYPVLKAWGFTTDEYAVPDKNTLEALLKNVDYTQINIDGNSIAIGDDMEIDLGSIAKGYTSSRIIDFLRKNGVSSALLNLGGNVHALGEKPDGKPWRVAIKDPFGDGNLCILEISDKCVITSGGYERYFEQDGEIYWHIIDPATGSPAKSGLVSVSVIGTDGLICDGLSTTLFIMGLEKATELWENSSDFDAVFVTEAGGIYITEGIEDVFSLSENYKNSEVTVIRRD